jgi:hypothetical protein
MVGGAAGAGSAGAGVGAVVACSLVSQAASEMASGTSNCGHLLSSMARPSEGDGDIDRYVRRFDPSTLSPARARPIARRHDGFGGALDYSMLANSNGLAE